MHVDTKGSLIIRKCPLHINNGALSYYVGPSRPHTEHPGARVQQQMEEVSSAEAALLHGLCKSMPIPV